jgi:DNA-binding MarR family transcriptional regulator
LQARSGWTFLSNHAHVLVAVARDPSLRIRDLARLVGVTERAVAQILVDLESAGAISKLKDGRRNAYEVHPDVPLRHPIEAHRTVYDILRLATPN